MSTKPSPQTGELPSPFWRADNATLYTGDAVETLRAFHMSRIILQWTANQHDNQYNGARTIEYPTSQSGYLQASSSDVVGKLLTAADQYNIEVVIGLSANDSWWNIYADDQAWLANEAQSDIALAQELWDRYGSHPSFDGWYLPLEMDNVHFSTSASQINMINYYKDITPILRNFNESLPIVVAPFFNGVNTALPGWQKPAAWSGMWQNLLRLADLDIVAVQDGVGAGHADAGTLPTSRTMKRTSLACR